MSLQIIVAGTDTGIGKTVFSAALAGALGAAYWKPVQSGLLEETDTQTVLRLSGLSPEDVIAERYRLKTPVSPHLAAEIDGITIDIETLVLPETEKALVVEAAGGLLVPLTRHSTYIDLIARWRAPVVLCARTSLGTINHSLLSIEALRSRGIPLLGVAFIGDENAPSEQIITAMGQTRRLGRLPYLAALTPDALRAAFTSQFTMSNFLEGIPG
jgi:dethiobiotin synthetase